MTKKTTTWKKKIMPFVLSATMLAGFCPAMQAAEASQVKNIIYMIPDGGGMSPFYLSDAFKQAGGWDSAIYPNATKTDKGEMYAKQYLVGAVTTYCANAEVTDSAAAGTALSSGYKTNKNYVGIDADKVPHANILEAAQYVGKNVGIVSTYEWTNATPAAFSAHDPDRGNYTPMSEQIVNQGIDVVLGGGFGAAKWGDISEAEIRGYDIMNTREDLENVQPGDKIWGNLVSGSFPYDIEYDESTPNIAEMTKAAITALDEGDDGFFLMVEGSKVDGGGHSNYTQGMVSEFLAFDEACKVALNYAEERDDTLVVIVPDHDTGGMNIPENLANAVNDLKKGAEPADITWETTNHTARNGGLFMYVPEGVEYPEGISGKNIGENKAYEENVIDNTEIAHYLADFMDITMEDISAELFVDVTDMGTYDEKIQLFRFNDYPVTVKRNASYAYLEDAVADLEGQVTVYVNKRFYVPQLLLDIAEGTKAYETYNTASLVDSSLELYMPDTTNINKWNGKIEITNLQPKNPVSGKIKFTEPEAFAGLGELEVAPIESTQPAVIEFECPEFDPSESGLTFRYEFITDDGKAYPFSSAFEGRAYAGYANDSVTIDGKLDESAWNNSVVMTCDDASRIVNIEDWKGDRDLSADFAMLWDDEYLYFNAVVTDEIFYQPAADSSTLWEGDSIQFAIHRDTEDATLHKKTEFEEIGFALVNGEPVAHRFRKQTDATTTGPIELGEGFEMASVRDGDDQIYELKIKWTELFGIEFNPKIGDVLSFSVLFNDNDGGGRRGWIEYGSGIGSSKDYTLFVTMPLLDFSNTNSDEIKIVYNGEALVSDVAPFIANDRVLVPVRVIFEALGAEVNWDGETGTVISKLGEDTVTLQIGASEIVVNGEAKAIDSPAQITNDRTMVPVRAVSEAYNCEVQWDEATRTVTVIK